MFPLPLHVTTAFIISARKKKKKRKGDSNNDITRKTALSPKYTSLPARKRSARRSTNTCTPNNYSSFHNIQNRDAQHQSCRGSTPNLTSIPLIRLPPPPDNATRNSSPLHRLGPFASQPASQLVLEGVRIFQEQTSPPPPPPPSFISRPN